MNAVHGFIRDDVFFLKESFDLTSRREVHNSSAQRKSSVEKVALFLKVSILLGRNPFHHEVGLDNNVEDIMRGIFEQQYLERKKRLLLSNDGFTLITLIPVHVSFC